MLEFLRRQTKPIMITLAMIIIVAFTFWGGYTQPKGAGRFHPEDTALTAAGRDYSYIEASRMQRSFELAMQMGLPGVAQEFGRELVMVNLLHGGRMGGGPLMYEKVPVDYALNLIVLRAALAEYGIRASDEEAKAAYRQLPQFTVDGRFDPERGAQFERAAKTEGFRQEDLYEVIRDSLGYQRLHQIVAGNLVANSKVAHEYYTARFQTIKAATIPFPLEDYKKKVEVSDEEIKKYFEEKKDAYKTDEKRAITWAFFASPDTSKLNAGDTVKAQQEFQNKVQKFGEKVLSPKVNFVDEAKAGGATEVKDLPAFSMAAPPEELKSEFRLLMSIFQNKPEELPVSDPVKTEKGYGFFKVTAVEEPKPQELKDVTDKVREVLVNQKASEAMTKAANDARSKMEEELKDGKKTLDDAAKVAGVVPQVQPEFSPFNPPKELSNGDEIAGASQLTPPGKFAKDIIQSENGVLLVYVISKELRKRDDSGTTRSTLEKGLDRAVQQELFQGWFRQRYNDAKIKADKLLSAATDESR